MHSRRFDSCRSADQPQSRCLRAHPRPEVVVRREDGGVETVEIVAGRLHLRPWQPDDADAVYEACQDPQIQRWTRVPSPYTREDARTWTEERAPGGWARGEDATFAVLDATSGRLLASVGLHRIDPRDAVGEIGYWCLENARQQGVTTEAVRAVCEWAFGGLQLARIDWYSAVGNWASRRLAEKVGFIVEGVLRSRLRHASGRCDAWVGGLLPEALAMVTAADPPATVWASHSVISETLPELAVEGCHHRQQARAPDHG